MTETLSNNNDFSANHDRLLIAITVAVLLHIIIMVGIQLPKPNARSFIRDIDVTIVTAPSQKAPEQSQFLAQDNQFGSSQSLAMRPMLESAPQLFKSSAEVKPVKVPPKKIKQQPIVKPIQEEKPIEPQAEVKPQTTPVNHAKPIVKAKEPVKPVEKIKPIVQKQTAEPVALPEVTEVTNEEKPPKETPEQKPDTVTKKEKHENFFGNDPPKKLSAASLQDQIAQLGNEVLQKAASEPRVNAKSVNQVSAHKYVAAQYLKDWETKVERTGNLNYPSIATKPGFYATLTMEVLINMDGSIKQMRITHSSGIAELDEAAKNIVRLSAPFPALPTVLRDELDVLKITRNWKFSDESLMTQ